MPTENKIDCPALHKRMFGYPYGDRVPRTVRMLITVTAESIPGFEPAYTPEAKAGQTYPVWTNSYGAVVAVMGDGARLGLRPAEFEVDTWHHLAGEPAPEHHAEPIAWMVGTAFWWTKEEAERDAAETGLQIVGLGPMTSIAPAQHQGEPVALPARKNPSAYPLPMDAARGYGWNACLDEIAKLSPLYTHADPGEVERLRAQLAERDALLHSLDCAWNSHDGKERFGKLMRKVETLAASAEPSVPAAQPGKCLDGGDCGIGGTCKWCPHTTASPAQQPS